MKKNFRSALLVSVAIIASLLLPSIADASGSVPSNPKVSIAKDIYEIGEIVVFSFSASDYTSLTLGIDSDNLGYWYRYATKGISQRWYICKFDTPGNYAAYVSASNQYGYTDSEKISFKVVEPTSIKPTISINKATAYTGEELVFTFSAKNSTRIDIGIDSDCDGSWKRIETADLTNRSEYRRSFDKPGNYTAYISAGYQNGYLESEKLSFVIGSKELPGPSSSFVPPVDEKNAYFRAKSNDYDKWYGYHDINGVTDKTPVIAIADGTVVYRQAYTTIGKTRYLTSYGNYIDFVSSDKKTKAVYAHLSAFKNIQLIIPSSQSSQTSGSSGKLTLETRDVKKGDILGYVGKTGNASGVHLHFELRISGTRVDPVKYVNMTGK